GKMGWPNAAFKIGPANTWTWVSVDLSQLQFSGVTPDQISGVDLGVNLFKFSPQAKQDYAPQEDKAFTYAIAEVVLSDGPYTPTSGPCGTTVDGGGTAVSNVFAANTNAYPNPASGVVYLKRAASGKVVDITGKVVVRFTNTTRIDVSQLPAGMYFIQTNNRVEKIMVK
ncbi:MAG: T9SS type A sorting domain-containing protein, partial [Bacteroidales bacterium]